MVLVNLGLWLENAKENIVYVAQGEDNEYLYSDEALITNINWISDKTR